MIFYKEAKTLQWWRGAGGGDDTVLSTNGACSADCWHVEECKLILSKAQFKVDQGPHIKSDMLNLIEKKLRKSLKGICTWENFLNRTSMTHPLRSTIDKWNCINLKSFCKAKDTVNRTKWQPTYLNDLDQA